MTFPLEGIRVLDLSQAVSGPYAGRILGDLGADVVKVFWSRDDVTSRFGKKVGGVSGLFMHMNAGKRGLGLDRDVDGGPDLLRDLAQRADVVIENFRPGVLDGAGLGYADLSAGNPRLVMLSISGFGRTSPEAQRQAYAPVLHAESGLLARQAALDDSEPIDIAFALADSVTGLHGAIAILAALALRARTGAGQHIDLAMLDAVVATDDYTHHAIDREYEIYAPRGTVWSAPGGPILIAADPKLAWMRIAAHAGIADPQPGADLATKIAARRAAIAAWIAGFETRDELLAELVAADLAWAEVRTTETLLDSPSLRARDVVAEVDDGQGGRRGVIRMPYRFSAGECDVRGPAPVRGQDYGAVLCDWLDLSPAEVERLTARGVLG